MTAGRRGLGMNELRENNKKEEEAHETKESIGAWTRDVPLVGPALEGNGYLETKEGAPESPCDSHQDCNQAERTSSREPERDGARRGQRCAAGRADQLKTSGRSNGRARANLIESDPSNQAKDPGAFIDKSEWLTTKEAAIQLRKFLPSGEPSVNAIHKLVAKGSLRRRKFAGRLFFRKREIDFLIESSVV